MEAGGRRRVAIALLLTLPLAQALTASSGDPDAGTGHDAGDTPWTALALPGYGAYTAVAPAGDRDWFYAVGSGAQGCVRGSLVAEEAHTFTFATAWGSGYRVFREDTPGGAPGAPARFDLVIASPSVRGTLAGVQPKDPSSSLDDGYSITVTTQTPSDTSGVRHGVGVMLTPRDTCYSGTLADSQDSVVRLLSASAGDVLDASLAGADTRLIVADPVGHVVAELASGDVRSIELPATGTYSMTTASSASSPRDFLVGWTLVGDPNPTQPCRPTCLMS